MPRTKRYSCWPIELTAEFTVRYLPIPTALVLMAFSTVVGTRPFKESGNLIAASTAMAVSFASLSFSIARATEKRDYGAGPALIFAGSYFATAAMLMISVALLRYAADESGKLDHFVGAVLVQVLSLASGMGFGGASACAGVGLFAFAQAAWTLSQASIEPFTATFLEDEGDDRGAPRG